MAWEQLRLLSLLVLLTCAAAQTVIDSCPALQGMKDSLGGDYVLNGNIDCTMTPGWNAGAGFQPVGNKTHPFWGRLDGAGFNITGLFINRTSESYIGLFGRTNGSAVLENIALREVNLHGYEYVGSVAGENECSMTNCSVIGNVSSVAGRVGGLAGENDGDMFNCYGAGQISGGIRVGGLVGDDDGGSSNYFTNCHFTGAVTGMNEVGGLVGELISWMEDCSFSGTVFSEQHSAGGIAGESAGGLIRCHSSGSVSSLGGYVGGLVGDDDPGSSYIQCHSTATVSGVNYVGGLIGALESDLSESYSTGTVSGAGSFVGGAVGESTEAGSIELCYAEGDVTGSSTVGGLVGENRGDIETSFAAGSVLGGAPVGGLVGTDTGSVVGCYWDITATGQSNSAGAGANGRTTAQMYREATFILWSFGTTWWIDEGCGYPNLVALTPIPNDLGCITPTPAANPTQSLTPTPEASGNPSLLTDGEKLAIILPSILAAVIGIAYTLWKWGYKCREVKGKKRETGDSQQMNVVVV